MSPGPPSTAVVELRVSAPPNFARDWIIDHIGGRNLGNDPSRFKVETSREPDAVSETALNLVTGYERRGRWDLSNSNRLTLEAQVFRKGKRVATLSEVYEFERAGEGCVIRIRAERVPVSGISKIVFGLFPVRMREISTREAQLLASGIENAYSSRLA